MPTKNKKKLKITAMRSGPAEDVLVVNPHTLAVSVQPYRTCNTCRAVKHARRGFFEVVDGRYSVKCRQCYERYWMRREDRQRQKSVEDHVAAAVYRANRRSRLRKSVGPPIEAEEGLRMWHQCEGKCANCRVELEWTFRPRSRNENRAVLDRVSTRENRSYAGNAQWMCTVCNEEKGGWDLVHQLQREIEGLRRRLRRKRKRREPLDYASVLIPSSGPFTTRRGSATTERAMPTY